LWTSFLRLDEEDSLGESGENGRNGIAVGKYKNMKVMRLYRKNLKEMKIKDKSGRCNDESDVNSNDILSAARIPSPLIQDYTHSTPPPTPAITPCHKKHCSNAKL
jgi:hypothetical protein